MRHLLPSLWLLTLLCASIELKAEILTCIVPDVQLDVALVTNENGTSHVNFTWQFSATGENGTICPQVLSVRMFSSIVPFEFEDTTEPIGHWHTDLRYTMLNGDLNYHIFTDIDTSLYYQFELRVQANPDSTGFRFNKYFSYIHYFSEQRAARVDNPAQPHTVIRAMKGRQVVFPCTGSGIPIPAVWLLRDPHSDPVYCSYPECTGNWNVIPSVRESNTGEYFCVATNTLVNPPLGKRMVRDWKTIQLIVETASDVLKNTSYCDTYTHSTCSAYIDQSQMVFIDGGSVDGDADILHQQVVKLFKKIERHNNRSAVNSALRDKCSQLAKSIACHTKFPYCHPDMTTPTPRQICKSTCDAFAVGGVCYDYLNADSTPELYSRLMFNCDIRQLPDPDCIPIFIETAEIATTSTPGVSSSTAEGTTAPATSTHVMLDPEVSTGVGESSSYVLLIATILPPFVLLVLIGILLILIVAMYAHRVLLVNKRALRQDAYYNNCEVGPPSLPTRTVKNTNNMPCKDNNTKPLYWTIADVKDGVESKVNGLDLTIEKNNTHVATSMVTGQGDLAASIVVGSNPSISCSTKINNVSVNNRDQKWQLKDT